MSKKFKDINHHCAYYTGEWMEVEFNRLTIVGIDEGATDNDGEVTVTGWVRSGLGIYSITMTEKGESWLDYHILHLRSGRWISSLAHPFGSLEMAKHYGNLLIDTGANFRLGGNAVLQYQKQCQPIMLGYNAACEHYWKFGVWPDGAMVIALSQNTGGVN